MKIFHVTSAEATKIHLDLLAQKSISIHFGTYGLGFKLLNELITQIKSSIVHNDLNPLEFKILKVNEFILI